jgi:hypothetical protein
MVIRKKLKGNKIKIEDSNNRPPYKLVSVLFVLLLILALGVFFSRR